MKKSVLKLWLFCLSSPVIANDNSLAVDHAAIKEYQYEILAQRNHKPTLFTQGLVLKDGIFYESSGLYSRSILVSYPRAEPVSKWAQMTEPFSQKEILPARYFAEGLTLLNDKLYLLTWQEGTVFVYDRHTFAQEQQWRYSGEGWGLTDNGELLIRSDGSHRLYFHNAKDFSLSKILEITEDSRPVNRLNELEFVDGSIWANIWHENRLIQIDPTNGMVTGSLDLTALAAQINVEASESVLNGIAYDAEKKALWITGKNWPTMYLVKVVEPTIKQ